MSRPYKFMQILLSNQLKWLLIHSPVPRESAFVAGHQMAKITRVLLVLLPILVWADFPSSCSGNDMQMALPSLPAINTDLPIELEMPTVCGLFRPFTSSAYSPLDLLHWHGGY